MINLNTLVLFFSILFAIVFMPSPRESYNPSFLLIISSISLLNILIFAKWLKNKLGTWINFHTFFLIGFIIVHIQIPLLAGFGIEPKDVNFTWVNQNVVNYGVWLCLVGILFWILGCRFYFMNIKNNKTVFVVNKIKHVRTSIADTFLVVFFLIFVSLVGKDFFGGNYDGVNNWGAGATYVFIILKVLLYLRLIYFFTNFAYYFENRSKYTISSHILKNKLFLLILLVFLMLFLISGDRGPIIEIGLLGMSCYSVFVKNISLKFLLLVVFVGSIIMTIIGIGRSVIDDEGSILEKGINAYLENDENNGVTDELANSIRIVFKAVNEVPMNYDYFLGITMISDLTTAIPFGSRYFIELTNLPEMLLSSTYFFTITGQGNYYTWGEGSEIIGDIYINFGVIGVMVLMFLFGLFITRLSQKVLVRKDFNSFILFFLLISASLYLNRSPLFSPVQLLFYGYIFDRLFRLKNG